jgi:type IV pilus assembly protein PilA
MKNKRMNDKGFSLVELIVVIAIMAILAVTLAPKLMKYVDSARTSSDQQTVNSIFTAAQIAYMQYPSAFQTADTLNSGGDDNRVQLRVATTRISTSGSEDALDTLYTSTDGATWTIDDTYATTNDFIGELQDTLGNFKLKSKKVGVETQITISLDANGRVVVTLDYDGDRTVDSADGDIQITE